MSFDVCGTKSEKITEIGENFQLEATHFSGCLFIAHNVALKEKILKVDGKK